MARSAAPKKAAAGPSTAKSAGPSRKRAAEAEPPIADSDDELELDGTLPQGDGEDEDEDDEQYEIDEGSSNGDLEDFEKEEEEEESGVAGRTRRAPRVVQRDAAGSGEDEDEKDSDDADFEDGDDDDEDDEGYNSSDIDDMTDNTSVSSTSRTDKPAAGSPTLDELIAQNTVKPDEAADTVGEYARGDGIAGGARFSQAKLGKGTMVPSKLVRGGWKREYEDIEAGYGSESSTEDVSPVRVLCEIRTLRSRPGQNPNTVGNIPMEWYDDLPHIGYSVDGKKIMRPAKGDELDKFLATVEDPDSW